MCFLVWPGVHGAGLTNSIFLPEAAAVMQLWPLHAYRINTQHEELAQVLGLRHLEWVNMDARNSFTCSAVRTVLLLYTGVVGCG